MYLNSAGGLQPEQHTHHLETKDYNIWWEGIVFIKGIPSNEDSLKKFVRNLTSIGIEKATKDLSGNYACVVQDKANDKYYAFVDNDGLTSLFCKDDFVSSSFLRLLENAPPKLDDLDPMTVVEFVHCGSLIGRKPFFDGIDVVGKGEIVEFARGKTRIISKGLEKVRPDSTPQKTFLENFSNIVASLRNRKISMDMTGGVDTRLISLLLKEEGIDFEAATLGVSGHPDVDISTDLAKILGIKHEVVGHTVGDEDRVLRELDEIFQAVDGRSDVFRTHYGYQHHWRRKQRNIDLVMLGNGGELYKYTVWWNAKKKEGRREMIERFVHSGLVNWYQNPGIPHDLFAGRVKSASVEYLPWLVNKLDNMFPNYKGIELADRVFSDYSIVGSFGVHCTGRFIQMYSPLLDRVMVGCGYGIPAQEKFSSNFHRRIISSLNKEVTTLRTTDGRFRNWYPDGDSLVWEAVEWARRKVRIEINKFRKTEPPPMGFDQKLYEVAKASKRGRENIVFLEQCGVVHSGLKIQEMDNAHFGRLFGLAEVLKKAT
ncbi:MAG: hypothetical protein V1754_08575 [Pseudomonadota bacterium]